MKIGDWIQREKRGVPHLVESIVAGDVVTKCGKRMRNERNSNGGLVHPSVLTRLLSCQVCSR